MELRSAYWLRHSGKPRASSARTPARFQLYLLLLHYPNRLTVFILLVLSVGWYG